LAAIVIFVQKSQAITLNPVAKTHPSVLLGESVPVGSLHADAGDLLQILQFVALDSRQIALERNIQYDRLFTGIHGNRIIPFVVSRIGGEVREWERQNFNPRFANESKGSSGPSICDFQLHSWRITQQVARRRGVSADDDLRPLRSNKGTNAVFGGLRLPLKLLESAEGYKNTRQSYRKQSYIWGVFGTKETLEIAIRFSFGPIAFWGGCILFYRARNRPMCVLAVGLMAAGLGIILLPIYWQDNCKDYGDCQYLQHDEKNVSQKLLIPASFRITINKSRLAMANLLSTDKKIAVVGALAEGSSIRSIERITGVHRDTIMRLGVKVGQGCTALMDETMRDLPCTRLEMDEIWGFVGKKDRNVRLDEDAQVGSVWTFCAIDADTKLVPEFKVGERNLATAKAFVQDVASRMAYRVQISTDGLKAYVDAIEQVYGANVDYGQIVKVYGHEDMPDNRRYSPPECISSEKRVVSGSPAYDLISTSNVEWLNATTRLHMRRLTRLTLAFTSPITTL
jgi:IS1 family transposase